MAQTASPAGDSGAGSPHDAAPEHRGGDTAAIDARWGWPMWRQRQADPTSGSFMPGSLAATNRTHRNWVTLGTVARPERAAVDARGLLTPSEGSWSVDWWIGAEDRWYLPARETTVRQRLVDDAPVVETAMRVTGGDVVQRTFAMSGDGNEPWLVMEIENRTAAAVAVVLAVRPWGPTGEAPVGSVALDDTWLVIDGRRAVSLPQVPWRVYAAGDSGPPVVTEVLTGADGGIDGTVTCPQQRAEIAVVFPLPHTLSVRFAIPMVEPGWRRRPRSSEAAPTLPASLPTATQVAAGWRAQSTGGVRIDLPDPSLAAATDAARRHLLLVPAGEDLVNWPLTDVDYPSYAAVLGALGAWGHPDEAADVLGTWEERQGLDGRMLGNDRRRDAAGAALVALGNHWRLTGDTDLVGSLVGPVAKAAHWIDRRATSRRHRTDPSTLGLLPDGDAPGWLGGNGVTYHDAWWSLRGLSDAAAMLDAVDQPDAAADARRFAGNLASALASQLAADVGRLGTPVVPAGPRRGLDGGVVAIADAVLLGLLDPCDPRVDATAGYVRDRLMVTNAVFDSVSAQGLSPMLTARWARVELARGDTQAHDRLRWLVSTAGAQGTWPELVHPVTGGGVAGSGHDPVATAEFLMAVRDVLVRDTAGVAAGAPGASNPPIELQVAPAVPVAWHGLGWEAHNLPTSAGRFSYAVRWHGERPALLWELDPADGVGDVVVRAPGLDPAWSSTEPSGEVLLGAPVAASPSSPVSPVSLSRPASSANPAAPRPESAPGEVPDGGFS